MGTLRHSAPRPLCVRCAGCSDAEKPGLGAGTLVLSISYHVRNDIDTGIKGNNWAFDTYDRAVRVWRQGSRQFCSASAYDGGFTTIAGWSPGGKTQITAGIRGTFRGSSVTRFRATLAAGGARVRGFVGSKDFRCSSADKKGECSGTWDWLREYFNGISRFSYVRYTFTYRALENGKGTWSDTLMGGKVHFSGDIRPAKN